MSARKAFTQRQRRTLSTQNGYGYGHRPRTEWGAGDLPGPYAEGDVLWLPEEGAHVERMRGVSSGYVVACCAFSIGEGDEWYMRVSDGRCVDASDRLHVIPGCDFLADAVLVETSDPDGLALRERMLSDGWTYTAPAKCPTCGQRVPS